MDVSIVKWKFKLNKLVNDAEMFYIGITAQEKSVDEDFADYGTGFLSYCIDDMGRRYRGFDPMGKVAFELKTGDVVKFTLNLKLGKFLGQREGDAEIELFEIEMSHDIKYKLVLQLGGQGMSATLVNFERH